MANSPPIGRYPNKAENRITFRIKILYYFKVLTLEKMKLFGNFKSKISKDKIVKM